MSKDGVPLAGGGGIPKRHCGQWHLLCTLEPRAGFNSLGFPRERGHRGPFGRACSMAAGMWARFQPLCGGLSEGLYTQPSSACWPRSQVPSSIVVPQRAALSGWRQPAEPREAGRRASRLGGGGEVGPALQKTLQISRLIPPLSYPPVYTGKLRTSQRKTLPQVPTIHQCKLPPCLRLPWASGLCCHSFAEHLPVPRHSVPLTLVCPLSPCGSSLPPLPTPPQPLSHSLLCFPP